jgi:hypothetical protein
VTPISQIELDGRELSERKVVAMLASTKEHATLPNNIATDLLGRELTSAMAIATDQEFIT